MRFLTQVYSSIFSLALTCTLSAANQASMLMDLNVIHSVFDAHYAPKEWKETHIDWDLSLQIQKAQRQVESNPNIKVKDFQIIVKNFLRSTQDYHVSAQLESTECSFLPFSLKSSEGRYFVYSIDDQKLDTKTFKIKIGDELISMDGKPVDAIAKKIIENMSRGVPDTDQAIANELITERGIEAGLPAPRGVVNLKFQDKDTGNPKSYQMVWHHNPEYFTFHREILSKKNSILPIEPVMIAADWITNLGATGSKMHVGHKESNLPPLGNIIWENDPENIFEAYIFQTQDGENVGFLRIPSYLSQYTDPEDELIELVAIITKFEEFTSKMVIDQMDNPGGKFFYLYGIASLFANEPLKTPKQKIMMTPSLVANFRMMRKGLENISTNEEADEALRWGDYSGMLNSMQLVEMLKVFCTFVINEWESGKNLSDASFFFGIDYINPHAEIVYTKPILLLINELAFSCGDFFPAIMQDNKRAVLMGNRTAGAGGAIFRHRMLTNNGIQGFTYTWTIAERADTKTPIENLGVTPDILYKPTPADLQYGNYEFRTAILKALAEMDSEEEKDTNNIFNK